MEINDSPSKIPEITKLGAFTHTVVSLVLDLAGIEFSQSPILVAERNGQLWNTLIF